MAEDPELDPTASALRRRTLRLLDLTFDCPPAVASGCASGPPRLSWILVPPCASSVSRSRRAYDAGDRSVRRSNAIAARVRLATE